jgi:hypothetical protein
MLENMVAVPEALVQALACGMQEQGDSSCLKSAAEAGDCAGKLLNVTITNLMYPVCMMAVPQQLQHGPSWAASKCQQQCSSGLVRVAVGVHAVGCQPLLAMPGCYESQT